MGPLCFEGKGGGEEGEKRRAMVTVAPFGGFAGPKRGATQLPWAIRSDLSPGR